MKEAWLLCVMEAPGPGRRVLRLHRRSRNFSCESSLIIEQTTGARSRTIWHMVLKLLFPGFFLRLVLSVHAAMGQIGQRPRILLRMPG